MMTRLRVTLLLLGCILGAGAIIHCGTERPDAAGDGDAMGSILFGPCSTEGEVRSCHAVVAQREGFVDCFEGHQQCVGGAWSPCDGQNGGATLTTRAWSGGPLKDTSVTAGGLHVLSISAPSPDAATCTLDPCNPYCVGYDDNPSTPVMPEAGCVVTITTPDAGARVCGNSIVEPGEQCDDGNSVAGDGCGASCQFEPGFYCPTPGSPCVASVCGNGIVEGVEQCDDGPWAADSSGVKKDRPFDGCYNCKREVNCPVGAGPGPTPCVSVCGDGLLFPGEGCDDGNTTDGDGCSSTCTVEPGATCVTITAPLPPYIDVPMIYRDRDTFGGAATSPDFQIAGMPDSVPHKPGGTGGGCVTGLKQGMLQVGLSPVDREPLYLNGQGCMLNSTSFDTWYHDGPTNKLILGHFIRLVNIGGGVFRFDSSADPSYGLPNINCGTSTCQSYGGFLPINGLGYGNQVSAKNYSFTDELRFPFTYNGGESLSFTGDDDLWVYIGGRKVVDLGNLHTPVSGSVTLALGGSVSTPANATATPSITLVPGESYEIAVFGAERNSTGSNYKLTLGGFTRKISQCTLPTTISIGPPATPTTYSNTYQATGCAPGTKAQWNTFGYKVSTPVGSEIKFSVQTSGDGGAGTWQPATGSPAGIVAADVPLDHPGGNDAGAPSCQVTGPSPCGNNCASAIGSPMTSACPATCSCPIDLYGLLSAPPNDKSNAEQPFLQINASLSSGPGGSCAGVLSPGLLSAPNGFNTCTGPKDVVVPNGPCSAATAYTDCDQDYHCDLVVGSPTYQKCIWNNGPNVWIDPACSVGGVPGFDLSIEAGCKDAAGVHVPICNRGGAAVPAGQVIEIWTDNSGGGCNKACTGTGGGKTATCSYTLPSPLGPGACINIPPSAGCTFSSGQRCMQVNPGNTVVDSNGHKECNSIANGATWPTNGVGAGCNNNNAAVKATPASCVACAAPLSGSSTGPALSSWQVSYSCVPYE